MKPEPYDKMMDDKATEGKPPLLSVDEMFKAMQGTWEFVEIKASDIDKGVVAVAQAQREADIKFYKAKI